MRKENLWRRNRNDVFLSSSYRFLWVDESVRHDGYGSQLIHKIEDIAKEKGCRLILLDSFSFQAPEFYKKHGYREYGVVEDHPKGYSQHFLEKRL